MKDGNQISLLDLYTTDFTLLVHGKDDGWSQALADSTDKVPLKIYTIGKAGSGADLIDVEEVWNDYYGIEESGAVLIRPDGHVAFRAATSFENYNGESITVALNRSLGLN